MQGVECSVVGVPKSIDNDILLVGTYICRPLPSIAIFLFALAPPLYWGFSQYYATIEPGT